MIALPLLAFALAMDAFAVALCQGVATRPGLAGAARIALAFGFAQAAMPLLGWGVGMIFAGMIEAVDHWVAFILLGALGLRMLREGMQPPQDCPPVPLSGRALFTAAIATSIDAAAAGVTLPAFGVAVLPAVAVIGGVTAALCLIGALAGARLGAALGKKAELFGGLVLIGLGVRILVEHLGGQG